MTADASARAQLMDAVLALSNDVRYVALYVDGRLDMSARPAVNASAAESDRYEELIVNPTLMLLTRLRGDIDCGGMAYLLVRYGAFYQLVMPWQGGHASIAIEPTADPMALQRSIARTLAAADVHT